MEEFPGFKRAQTAATVWLNALTKQSELLNTAWDSILKGNYGPRDLLRDQAQYYQRQFQALEAMLPGAAPAGVNVPSWLTLDATKNQTLQAFTGSVETRPYDYVSGNPTHSKLAAFSDPRLRFAMKPTCIDSTHILVTIEKFYESNDSEGRSLATNEDVEYVVGQASGTGPYLGIIYDQRGGTTAPLAVVTLMI